MIKYNALTAYYRIIQERSRRTRLIVERNLLQCSATESWDKSTLLGMGAGAAEATALAARLRVFMQIMAREEFKSLLEGIAQDRRVCAEIARLKALRVRGVRALNEQPLLMCTPRPVQGSHRRSSRPRHRRPRARRRGTRAGAASSAWQACRGRTCSATTSGACARSGAYPPRRVSR